MKKLLCVTAALMMALSTSAFNAEDFSLSDLGDYQREFKSESIGTCSTSSVKTYEDYRLITSVGSKQYQYIHNHMTVDETTGLLIDEEGFIGVALGYQYGEIGSRYYIVLDTGNIIPVVKVDAKAATDVPNGCANDNGSMIEFVIDTDKALEYFGTGNGLASNGNFNNYKYFKGNVEDVEKVYDERLEEGVTYQTDIQDISKADEESDSAEMLQGGY